MLKQKLYVEQILIEADSFDDVFEFFKRYSSKYNPNKDYLIQETDRCYKFSIYELI